MTEIRDDLLSHYRASRDALLAALEGLGDDQMAEASIDGWSVKDHLLHLATWDDIRAAEVERISAGHESAWKMSEAQDLAFNALAYDLRKGLSLEQARWELERSRRRLLDAIASATVLGLDVSRYGEAGLRSGHEAQHAGWIRRWRVGSGY